MCRKKQHVKIDGIKEMSDLICGKAAVGGNYNSTRDNHIIELDANECCDETINISLIKNKNYIVCEHQVTGGYYFEKALQGYWIVQYNGSQLDYVASFAKTGGGTSRLEYTGYDFNGGKCIGRNLLFAEIPDFAETEPLYKDFDQALIAFFEKYGVKVKNTNNSFSRSTILSDNNQLKRITEYRIQNTDYSYNNGQPVADFKFSAQDYTDMRAKISVKDAWVDAYAQLLYALQDKNYYAIHFELGNVNEDEIPELFVSKVSGSNRNSQISVYVYFNSNALYVGDFGSYGEMSYSIRSNIIDSYYSAHGFLINNYYGINNGNKIELVCFESTDDESYLINGEIVTKDQYSVELKKYQEYNYVKASYYTEFMFSDETIQKFCQNPLDFINPNEK